MTPITKTVTIGPWTGADSYADLAVEYEAASRGIGLHDRAYRGLLEITGKDRLAWLHNLTTNQVKSLQPGQGNYTFAVNIQGRILFDMNLLVLRDSVWLDIDRRWIDAAIAHFNKYIIMEDVKLADRTADFARFALTGARVAQFIARAGLAQSCAMPLHQVEHLSIDGAQLAIFRDDFCGPFGLQILVPMASAINLWQRWTATPDVTPIGFGAVDTLRIEHGIPWPMTEITPETLPAETGQFQRAVSTNKGCYLGQEIVERMRSRGAVARRLVLIHLPEGEPPPAGSELLSDGAIVGKTTSACVSQLHGGALAMGYVRSAVPDEAPVTVSAQGRCTSGSMVSAATATH
ncbi:MAG: folate-binding protein YgfZ [Phycisphaerales bacterium]|nr:folate-binding protein YgfZ [Phycisphaerales bacterium]